MMTKLWKGKEWDWPFWSILLSGFLFRFLYLAIKPPHFDEGINGWFVDQVILRGYYAYDPTNYHGPLHFYILLFFKLLMGRNLWALRVPACIFGLLSVWLMMEFKPYLGKFTAYGAALFAAVSPGMIFYSRYAIHETELLFFSLLALLGYLRHCHLKDKISLWQISMGITGMILTKETYVLHLGCFGLALLCLKIYEKFYPSLEPLPEVEARYERADVWKVAGVSLFLIVFFYSGFFQSARGFFDLLRSVAFWMRTGENGNGQGKPFFYWGELFVRYEYVALAGLIVSLKLLWPAPATLRLIAIYGIGTFLAYSIINYKTPWCVLQIIWPFLFIASSILSDFARHGRKCRNISATAACGFAVIAGVQSFNLNYLHNSDEQEPYVYVQTFPSIMEIYAKLQKLVAIDRTRMHMPINLLMGSNWPLPWLLGDYTKVGYLGPNYLGDPDGGLVICDDSVHRSVEMRMKRKYFFQRFRLRSAQEDSIAYFDAEIFKDFFASDAPVFTPQPVEPLKPGEGILASYFGNARWEGKPLFEKQEREIDFRWTNSNRPLPAPFGIVFAGQIYLEQDGPVTFYLTSDDGSQLIIDKTAVVDNLGVHAEQTRSGDADLKMGWHDLQVKYFDMGGEMVVRLGWRRAKGTGEEKIPTRFFRTGKTNFRAPIR